MKKLLSVVLCFSMIFALCVPAFAVETDQENMSQEFSAVDEFLTTNEDAMPPVPDFSVQTTNPVSTLNMPSRAAWVKNTTETLESAYSQSVVDVSETKDFIVFTFEEPEEIYNDFGYPQFFAARLLKQSIIRSVVEKSGKGGTYFGATGCGKTYTMAFLARQLALRCTGIY